MFLLDPWVIPKGERDKANKVLHASAMIARNIAADPTTVLFVLRDQFDLHPLSLEEAERILGPADSRSPQANGEVRYQWGRLWLRSTQNPARLDEFGLTQDLLRSLPQNCDFFEEARKLLLSSVCKVDSARGEDGRVKTAAKLSPAVMREKDARDPKAEASTEPSKEVEALIGKLNADDSSVRSAAVDGLVRLRVKATLPLIRALKSENASVRSCATISLGRIGDKTAVTPLIEALRDEDKFTRRGAALALGMIGDDKAVGPLITLLEAEMGGLGLDDSESRVVTAQCAAKALNMITGKPFGFDHKEWRRWWDETHSSR